MFLCSASCRDLKLLLCSVWCFAFVSFVPSSRVFKPCPCSPFLVRLSLIFKIPRINCLFDSSIWPIWVPVLWISPDPFVYIVDVYCVYTPANYPGKELVLRTFYFCLVPSSFVFGSCCDKIEKNGQGETTGAFPLGLIGFFICFSTRESTSCLALFLVPALWRYHVGRVDTENYIN